MEYSYLVQLKQQHAAWRLLNADLAPLLLSFLHEAFLRPNARSIPQSELLAQLDDHLYLIEQAHGVRHARSAQEYLDAWTSPDTPYLRRYYPDQGDEPEYDLTPAAEKALDWVRSLEERQFVGTESRLVTIFELLRDIVRVTETDVQARIHDLERQKAEIDQEIARLGASGVEPYSPTQVKERFVQAEETARRLLSDFRQVEENFRALDRQTRERIALSTQRKGELLDAIFGEQNAITSSDQGKSFRAFWTFLMSTQRQGELENLLSRVLALEEVQSVASSNDLLPRIKYQLMDAGAKVQKTTASLVEQLRKYLDERIWAENRRILGVIHEIERHALALRDRMPREREFAAVDSMRPDLELPMARGLFRPTEKLRLETSEILLGVSDDVPLALFEQKGVNMEGLRANIRHMLRDRSQVSLLEVVEAYPLVHGLGEVVAYLHLAQEDPRATVLDSARERLVWRDARGERAVSLPRVLFTR